MSEDQSGTDREMAMATVRDAMVGEFTDREMAMATVRDAMVGEFIAAKLKLLRRERGLSQQALAERIGCTFQQVQKYEKGTNRVSAEALHLLAETLHSPITFFFPKPGENLPEPAIAISVKEDIRRLREGVERLNAVVMHVEKIMEAAE